MEPCFFDCKILNEHLNRHDTLSDERECKFVIFTLIIKLLQESSYIHA